jgi:hypothetical protein
MNASRLKLWRLWGVKKRARTHAERRSELAQNCDVHAPLATLVPADHALADAGEQTQLFLAQPALLAPFPEIQPGLAGCIHAVDIMSPDLMGQPA